jgi:hypothetical protein
MTDAVRDAYDARAKEYASFALGDLDRVPPIASGSERSPGSYPPAPGWLRTSVAGLDTSSTTWPSWA